jgi:serine/threonine protein kinase
MDNTDDTFIAGGMSPSFSGFSDDEEKTFIEGSSPRGADGVSRYQIESEIGRGGTGLVYLATDTRFNRKVALKRITGDQFTPGTSGPRQNITMFMTEVKALASLQHANIVHVYDVGMDGDGMYMVMEYLDGGSLKDRVLQSGPLNPEETARMGIQLCDALSMVHENGIVHRDIKPGNVLMTKRGMPKLADFDLVLDTASNREVAGAFLGTLHYMSPEQRVDSGQVDFRSDLFSLGATLYFAATGSVPEKIDPDKLHESLRSVIQKALQENLLFRFASALDMKKAFEEVLKTQIAEQAPGGHGAGTFPCYACSKLIPNGAVYCPECGKDLIEARKGIEKQVTEALGTVDGLVSKDMYREARDLLKDIQEKVKHPHFVYFKRRIDEKTVWVEKEEKKYQDREAELTQELHKAQEALAALNLEKASEIAQGIVKEERRFDALARKAREVIHKCEEIVGRRRQFEKDTAEASRLADTKAFDKALGLLSSILNESNPAYAEQREASAHLRDTLLARVKRLEEGLKARLAEAQAALDADRLDDAFHQATELVTEASHITYQDTFKNITDQSRELVKACHNQVAQYLENAQERSNNKVFDEAYVLLDKVLNLSAGAFSGDREKAAEAKIRFRWQELEHHMAVAAESVSQKNFEEAFRLLNLVIEEKSETYKDLKAKATVALILAKRKRLWRKVRIPLFLVVLTMAGVAYGYHYYLTNILTYTLTIDVEPKQASIRILDIPEPYTPGMKLHSGKYRVEASAKGYETARKEILLYSDNSIPLRLSPVSFIARDDTYVAYSNGVVTYTYFLRDWFVGPDKHTTWDEAKSWADNLIVDGGGWRLPTIDELGWLYRKGIKGASDRNMTPLLKTTGWCLWSEEGSGPANAWVFDLQTGSKRSINRLGHGELPRAFAVRAMSERELLIIADYNAARGNISREDAHTLSIYTRARSIQLGVRYLAHNYPWEGEYSELDIRVHKFKIEKAIKSNIASIQAAFHCDFSIRQAGMIERFTGEPILFESRYNISPNQEEKRPWKTEIKESVLREVADRLATQIAALDPDKVFEVKEQILKPTKSVSKGF